MTGAVTIIAMMLTAGETATNLPVLASSCVACHLKQEAKDPALADPAKAMHDDVHAKNGLGCADCHGGNPQSAPDQKSAAHDEAMGFAGAPATSDIPELCGKCHGDADYMRKYNPRARVDQLTEYKTSKHGQLLAQGDDKVATCVSCHGKHGILPVKDPRSAVYATRVADTCARCHSDAKLMASYGIPTDQKEKWDKSVHGKAVARGDTAAPSCNGCHGNHGAQPPEVKNVANVCGHCHAREATLFAASPLRAPWEKLGLSECTKCHSNHLVLRPTDQMVGTDQGALCSSCHEHGNAGLGVAAAVRASYDGLHAEIEKGAAVIDRAEQLGMEISEQRYSLTEARNTLVESRVLVHSFDQKTIGAKVEEGMVMARKVQEDGRLALEHVAYRRKGLAVALGFILLTIVALWLKIRQVDAQGQA